VGSGVGEGVGDEVGEGVGEGVGAAVGVDVVAELVEGAPVGELVTIELGSPVGAAGLSPSGPSSH
jgi:hypothetical protein